MKNLDFDKLFETKFIKICLFITQVKSFIRFSKFHLALPKILQKILQFEKLMSSKAYNVQYVGNGNCYIFNFFFHKNFPFP